MDTSPPTVPPEADEAPVPVEGEAAASNSKFSSWSLIQRLLKDILETYLIGIPQGSTALLSGNVELNNIELNTSAISDLLWGLPFSLKKATVKEAKLHISYLRAFTSQPIELHAKGVVVELDWGSLTQIPSDPKKVEQLILGEYEGIIAGIWAEYVRLFQGKPGEAAMLGNESSGKLANLLPLALVNACLYLEDVVVRLNVAGNQYVEVCIDSASIDVTDKNFVARVFDRSLSRIMRKVIKVSGLTISIGEGQQPQPVRHLSVGNKHVVLPSADVIVNLVVDNRGDRQTGDPSKHISIVTSELNLDILPSHLALVKKIISELGLINEQFLQLRTTFLRLARRNVDEPELIQEYANLCRLRWIQPKQLNDPPQADQKSLELRLGPDIVRSVVAHTMQEVLEPIVDVCSVLQTGHMSLSKFNGQLRRSPKCCATDEVEVTFTDAKLGLVLDAVNGRLGEPRLQVVSAKGENSDTIVPGMILTSIAGMDITGIDDSTQEEFLSRAGRPLRLRFKCSEAASPLRFRILVPYVRLRLAGNEVSSDTPFVAVVGTAFQFDTKMGGVSSIGISILGIGGNLLQAGLNVLDLDEKIKVSDLGTKDRVSLSQDVLLDEDLALNNQWLEWCKPKLNDVNGIPLLSSFHLGLFPDKLALKAKIGDINISVSRRLADVILWLKAVPQTNQPESISIEPSAKPEYVLDIRTNTIRIALAIPSRGEELDNDKWKTLNVEVFHLALHSDSCTVNSFEGRAMLRVRAGEQTLASFDIKQLQLGLSCSPACCRDSETLSTHIPSMGAASTITCERIQLSRLDILNLLRAKSSIEDILVALATAASNQKPVATGEAPITRQRFSPAHSFVDNTPSWTEYSTGNLMNKGSFSENSHDGESDMHLPRSLSRRSSLFSGSLGGSFIKKQGDARRRHLRDEVSRILGYTPDDFEKFVLLPSEAIELSRSIESFGIKIDPVVLYTAGTLERMVSPRSWQHELRYLDFQGLLSFHFAVSLQKFDLALPGIGVRCESISVAVTTYPELGISCELRNARLVDLDLRPIRQASTSFFRATHYKLLSVGNVSLTYYMSNKSTATNLVPEAHPFVMTCSHAGQTVSSISARHRTDDHRSMTTDLNFEGDHDFLRVSVRDVMVHITYDALEHLLSTKDKLFGILSEGTVQPHPPQPGNIKTLSESGVDRGFVFMCDVAGISATFDDMTRITEVARVQERLDHDPDSIFARLQRVNGRSTISILLQDGLNSQTTSLPTSETRSILVTFARLPRSPLSSLEPPFSQGSVSGDQRIKDDPWATNHMVQKGAASLHHISVLMAINRIESVERKRLEVLRVRSRTILNPIGVNVNYIQRDLDNRNLTLVQIDLEKAFRFSIWAEEVLTLQEIASNMTKPVSHAEDDGLPITMSGATQDSRLPSSQGAIALSGTEPAMNGANAEGRKRNARYGSKEKRVSFADSDTTSRESYHTARESAVDDEERAESSTTKPAMVAELMIKISVKKDVALEIVKRSLSRISLNAFVPVLSLAISPLTLTVYSSSMLQKDFSAQCFFQTNANIYNVRLAAWEPLIEPFRVDFRARKLQTSRLDISFWVVSRININMSEGIARLLLKLLNDFSTSLKSSEKDQMVKKYREDAYRGQQGYLLNNMAGDEINLSNLFEAGCGTEGKIFVEIKDAWLLPDRTRVREEPRIEGRMLPWREILVINHSPSEGSVWKIRPLRFEVNYPGTTTEVPVLRLVAYHEFIAEIPLAPFIVEVTDGGVSSWVPFKRPGGEAMMEMLIKIEFIPKIIEDPAPSSGSNVPEHLTFDIEPDSEVQVSFEGVTMNRDVNAGHKSRTILRRSAITQNTMRGATLSTRLFGHSFATQLLVDETGTYVLPLAIYSEPEAVVRKTSVPERAEPSFAVSDPELIIKSAMRPGGARVIQVQSPVIISNETDVPVVILISTNDPNQQMDTKADSNNPVRHEATLRQDMDAATTTDNLGSQGICQLAWHSAPPVHDDTQSALLTSSGALFGWADEFVYESSTAPPDSPYHFEAVRLNFQSCGCKAEWRLLGHVQTTGQWIVIGAGQPDKTPLLRDSRHNVGADEEKENDPVEILEVDPSLPFVCFRLECRRVEFMASRHEDFASALLTDSVLVDARKNTPLPSHGVSGNDIAHLNQLSEPDSFSNGAPSVVNRTAQATPRSVPEQLSMLGFSTACPVEFLEAGSMLQPVTWQCVTCGEKNPDSSSLCQLCSQDRHGVEEESQTDSLQPLKPPEPSLKDTKILRQTSKGMLRFTRRRASDSSSAEDKSVRKKKDSPVTHVLQPGARFAVPVRYQFATTDESGFKVFVRPLLSLDSPEITASFKQGSRPQDNNQEEWSTLVGSFAELRKAAQMRYWLRSNTGFIRTALSAYVKARAVPHSSLESSGAGRGRSLDQKFNKIKIGIVPWIVIQNALPFKLNLQFKDGLTPRQEIFTLLPGQERGFIDVDEQNMVQFQIEGYEPWSNVWSSAVNLYREDTTGYADVKSDVPKELKKRVPKRREVLYFEVENRGTLKLTMERTNDSRASLRCVVYAACWVFNFSDVGVSAKPGRSLLATASAAASARAAVADALEESYLLAPLTIHTATEDERPILPALVHTAVDTIRISGVLNSEIGIGSDSWRMTQVHGIQPMEVVKTSELKRRISNIVFSKPRYNVKLAASVMSCDFIFPAPDHKIRLVSVEVGRPDKPPFNRSWKVIIRPRFVLTSQISGLNLLFKETASHHIPGVSHVVDRINDLAPAVIDDQNDDDVPRNEQINGDSQSPGTSRWQSSCVPIGKGAATDLPSEQRGMPSRGRSSAPPLEGLSRAITVLREDEIRPYHFALTKQEHKFIFAVQRSASIRTGWSGVMSLENAEGDYCVLLRDSKGSPRGNGAIRIRVEVNPRTNGSTYVTFKLDEPKPSFEVDNRTKFALEIKQKDARGNLILQPNSVAPIGWDEPMKAFSISVRALSPLLGPESTGNRNLEKRRSAGNFFGITFSHQEKVRETGAPSSDSVYTPASTWYAYPMDTVSERDSIRIISEPLSLRAEGIVRDSTRVLKFTEASLKTPAPETIAMVEDSYGEDEANSSARRARSTDGKPPKCIIKVRLENGVNFDTCEGWQSSTNKRSRFHPYILVSMAGQTKQSSAKTKGVDDVYKPNWSLEQPIKFALDSMPHSITFNILNKSTDEREVLGIKRVTIPRALFYDVANAQAQRRKEDASTRSEYCISVGSARWNALLSLEEKMHKAEVQYARKGLEAVQATVRRESPGDNCLQFAPMQIIKQDVGDSPPLLVPTGASISAPALVETEADAEQKAAELCANELEEYPTPYHEYEALCSRISTTGDNNVGYIEFAPLFGKDGNKESAKVDDLGDLLTSETPEVEGKSRPPRLAVFLCVELLQDEDEKDQSGPENPYSRFLEEAETKFLFRVNSLALSIINATKRQEVAYAILQRLNFNLSVSVGGLDFDASLGNVQVDNHVLNCQFPVAIFCTESKSRIERQKRLAQRASKAKESGNKASGVKKSSIESRIPVPFVFAEVKVLVHTTQSSVKFVEIFRASVKRLHIALEERFLAEVMSVFVRAGHDLNIFQKHSLNTTDSNADSSVGNTTKLALEVAAMQPDGNTQWQRQMEQSGTAGSKTMLYLSVFETVPLRIIIDLDLEGGREINEPDDTINAGVRVRIPLLTLEVRDLFLRIAGMRRTGWFLSSNTLLNIVLRHYVHQFIFNIGRILTNTNWAGNPLQASKSVAAGFYYLIREPLLGLRNRPDNPVYGFFSGLSAGATALLANVATGISETVHGLTNTTVSAFRQVDESLRWDITTQPVLGAVELVRNVSGALAVSAREITDEVVAVRFEKPTHIRARRELGKDGLIIEYGGGRFPRQKMLLEERRRLKFIQQWIRDQQAVALRRLSFAIRSADTKARPTAKGRSEDDDGSKESWFRKLAKTVNGGFEDFVSEWKRLDKKPQ